LEKGMKKRRKKEGRRGARWDRVLGQKGKLKRFFENLRRAFIASGLPLKSEIDSNMVITVPVFMPIHSCK
jgi:hypothetical protein